MSGNDSVGAIDQNRIDKPKFLDAVQPSRISVEFPMRSRHRPAESLLFAEFCKKFPVLRRMSMGDRFVSDCTHHHPVLPKPQIPAPTPNRPFLWGFSLVSFRSFRLWRHLRSLSPILASRLCIQKFRSPRQGFSTARSQIAAAALAEATGVRL